MRFPAFSLVRHRGVCVGTHRLDRLRFCIERPEKAGAQLRPFGCGLDGTLAPCCSFVDDKASLLRWRYPG